MAYEQVLNQWNAAQLYAATATTNANGFITALNTVVAGLAVPVIDVSVPEPTAPVVPSAGTISVVAPGTGFPTDPGVSLPTVPNTDFTLEAAPTAPSLRDFSYSPGVFSAPGDAPTFAAHTLPTSPATWAAPDAPTLLNFSIRAFGGTSDHADLAAQVVAPDELVLLAPTAFDPPEEGEYGSEFVSHLQVLLYARMSSGTGIPTAVEDALWQRARGRIAVATNADIAEVTRNAEARGFAMPPGTLVAGLREAQMNAANKMAEASIDIASKQADLEQANVKQAIEQGLQLETQLIQHSNNVRQRAFDAARYLAENAVAVYNAVVEQHKLKLQRFSTLVDAYRAFMDAEKVKIETYRAEIEAESAKVQVNQSIIAAFRAQIEARQAVVALYGQELEAARLNVEIDKLNLSVYAERVQAYVAEVNAESAKAEVYKAQLQSNSVVLDQYKTTVDSYVQRMGLLATTARTRAEIYDTQVRAFGSAVQAYGTRISAESERVRTLVGVEALRIQGFTAQTDSNIKTMDLQIASYRALSSHYEARKSLALQHSKIMSDSYMAIKSMVADASKVGAQVNAQLAASAYGTVHANASIQGSSSMGVNYSYSNDTTTAVPPVLSV